MFGVWEMEVTLRVTLMVEYYEVLCTCHVATSYVSSDMPCYRDHDRNGSTVLLSGDKLVEVKSFSACL